jgi:hypothetical protein
MYFVWNFNDRWLKDSSFLCCMAILLSKEGKMVDNIQIGCFIELINIYLGTKSNEA